MITLRYLFLISLVVLIHTHLHAQTFQADSVRFYTLVDSMHNNFIPLNVQNRIAMLNRANIFPNHGFDALIVLFENKNYHGSAMYSRLKQAMNRKEIDSVYFYADRTTENILKYENEDTKLLTTRVKSDLIYWYLSNRFLELAIKEVNFLSDFAKKNNLQDMLPLVYMNLSSVYLSMDKAEKSIETAQKGLDIISSLSNEEINWEIMSGLYGLITQAYIKIDNFEQSHYYLKRLFELNDLLPKFYATKKDISFRKNKNGFTVYAWMSISYSERGDNERAWEALSKANHYFEQLQDSHLYKFYFEGFSILKKEMYAAYYICNKEYREALKINDQICSSIDTIENPVDYKILLKQKADILELAKDYKSAAQLRTEALKLTDSINAADMNSQINSLWVMFEVDKAQMQKQQAELKTQSLHIIAVGLSFIILLAVCIIILFIRKNKELKLKNKTLYNKEKEMIFLSEIIGNNIDINVSKEIPLYDRIVSHFLSTQEYTNQGSSVDMLAETLSVNRKYIADAIRQNSGLTVSEFINTFRLEHACRLLSNTNNDLTIKEIYVESGFNNRMTFSRIFKEKYGMTPTEFKACAKEDKTND